MKHLKELSKGDGFIYNQLVDLRNALLKGRFYSSVESVSKSGSGRIIKFGYIKNNRLVVVHREEIKNLAGCNKNGRITGGGMDMLFHSQYILFRKLCPKSDYRTHMKEYNRL